MELQCCFARIGANIKHETTNLVKEPLFWFKRSSELAFNQYRISSAQFYALVVALEQDANYVKYHPSEDEIRIRLIKSPELLKEFAKTNPNLASAFDLLQQHVLQLFGKQDNWNK